MIAHSPKRRWFRFSLRSLFVAVTLFACWLGWNWRQVRERDSLLQLAGVYRADSGPLHRRLKPSVATSSRVPVAWRLLGARRVGYLHLDRYRITDAQFEHFRAMFPEADLVAGYIVGDDQGLDIEFEPRSTRPMTRGRLPDRRVSALSP